MLKRPVPVCLAITLAALILFTVRIAMPHQPVFDEVHYVPAARALLALDRPANVEHPMLGKELIALGIALFGDGPFGWRIMSALAASVVVAASFAALQLAFGRVRTSAFAAGLVTINFTVFVQARIAMLDGFMAAFVVSGIACAAWAMRRGGWARWLAAGALLGLATACKWAALPFVALAGLAFLWLRRGDGPRRFPGLPTIPALIGFGAVAVLAYLATFAPAFFYAHDPLRLADLPALTADMYARQTQVLPAHTYQSSWWTWPLLHRPIWYLYEPADGAQRGILMIGNPTLMWPGLMAVAACVWAGLRGSRAMLAMGALWIASVAIYALIPKSLGFYYYYYLSSILIVWAIAATFDHWRTALRGWDEGFAILALGVAIHFFPILSAQALDGPAAFHRWTWFRSWI